MSLIDKISISISHIGKYWQDPVNGQILRWNIFAISINLVILLLKYSSLPPQIPLNYSLPWGTSQLASSSNIFLLPSISIVVLLINNLLAVFYIKSSRLLSKLLIIYSLLVSTLCTYSLFQIIRLLT